MKKKLLIIILFATTFCYGATISGPTLVKVGDECVYTSSAAIQLNCWAVTGANIISKTTTSVRVKWIASGRQVVYNSCFDGSLGDGKSEEKGASLTVIVESVGWTLEDDKIYIVSEDVGIGTNDPKEKLHINGSVRGNQAGSLRISSGYGYVDVGPRNTAWSHFYTDRPKFYFNKGICVDEGIVSSYNENLVFKTDISETRMTIDHNNGNVGVGGAPSSYKFTVAGDIYARAGWLRASGARGLYFESYGGGLYMTDATWIRTYGSKSFYHNAGIMRTDGTFQVGPGGNRFIVSSNGHVGIGTTTGSTEYKLSVKGKIRADEVKVYVDWADYVFEPSFKLKTLEEVDKFIEKNKHLPDVPNEDEVLENGVELGEMNKILLQKIEELTLYVIELNEKNTQLENRINKLEE